MEIKLTEGLDCPGSVKIVSGTKESILKAIGSMIDDSVESVHIIKRTKETVLQNFLKSIEVYGGIQELFREMNKISPQYVKELEGVYIESIRRAAEKG